MTEKSKVLFLEIHKCGECPCYQEIFPAHSDGLCGPCQSLCCYPYLEEPMDLKGPDTLDERCPIRVIPTGALVAELRKRQEVCIGLQVNEGEPFEISIDAEDIEVPWAEGPGVILLVFE